MSGPSSKLVTAPLSILKSVKTIRDAQFRDLDFPAIEKFAFAGVRGLLEKRGAYGKDLGTASATQEGVDEQAEREVSKEVSQYLDNVVPKLTAYMEAVSPLLVKYTTVLEETKEYVKKQLKNCNFLIVQGSLFYGGMVVFFTIKIAQLIRRLSGVEITSAVSKWYIGFVAFHFVFHTLLILLKRRKSRFEGVDFGILDRVNSELAKNVFVRFANAYVRGVAKEFTREEITRRSDEELRNVEDAEMSVVNRACDGPGGDDGGELNTVGFECVLNACDQDASLEDTLRREFRGLLESVRDKFVDDVEMVRDPKCIAHLATAFKNFAELQRGHMFDSADVRDNWQSLVRGVEDVRMLIMRELDIPPENDEKAALEVVKEDVVPALQLSCVETAKLKPVDRATDSFQDKFMRHLDKDKCWEYARSISDCRWAYFVPGKGCVYATESTGYDTSDAEKLALEWCPDCDPPRPRSEANFQKYISDAKFDKGILLLTLRPEASPSASTLSADDVLFVTTEGARGVRDAVFKNMTRMTTQTSTDTTTNKALNKCATQTKNAGDGEGRGSCAAVSINPSDNASVPERWAHNFLDLDYTKFFEDKETAEDTPNSDRFYVKQSRRALFEAHKASGMGSTMATLRPVITAGLTELMKRHKNRVNLSRYTDYIDTKLKEYYGAQTYVEYGVGREAKRVLRDVVKNMESLGEDLMANVKYVSSMRFSEKMRDMDDREVQEKAVDFGRTAYAANQLFRNAQQAATDSDAQKNVGGRILDLLSKCGLTIAVLILVIYNSNRVADLLNKRISGVHASSVIMLATMAVLLLFALVSSMSVRKNSNDKFNKRVSEENSRVMVTAMVDARDHLVREVEIRVRKRLESSNESDQRLTEELSTLYVKARDGERADKLKEHVEGPEAEERKPLVDFLTEKESDHEMLYGKLRRTVDAFDRCNTLITGPMQAPFPVYEITMYTIIACLILAILVYSLLQLRFIQRMRDVGVLGEAKSNLKRNLPIDVKYIQKVIGDSKMHQTRKDIILWVVAIILCVAMIMMMHLIVTSSQSYESGLYASSMYVNNRCTRSRRTAGE